MTKHGLAGALRAGTSSDATLFDETYDAIVGALAKRGARETHVRELRIIRAKEGRQMADEALGPISYLVVQFPGNKMTGEGFPILVDLVDRGLIRILDLVFVRRDTDGTVRGIDIGDIDHDGLLDLAVFEGAASGLLDGSDLGDA